MNALNVRMKMDDVNEEVSDVSVTDARSVELHDRMVIMRRESSELPSCLSGVSLDVCDLLSKIMSVPPSFCLNSGLLYAAESVSQGDCSPPQSDIG